jgi:hypothetical protein
MLVPSSCFPVSLLQAQAHPHRGDYGWPAEKFSFSHHGLVTGAKVSSLLTKLDPAQLQFFLLSNEALFEAIYEWQSSTDLNSNPESVLRCILSSPYVMPLFTFGEGRYNKTFLITHPDEDSPTPPPPHPPPPGLCLHGGLH